MLSDTSKDVWGFIALSCLLAEPDINGRDVIFETTFSKGLDFLTSAGKPICKIWLK